MAHPQTPDSGNENPEYYEEDAKSPMTEREFLFLPQTPDISTQNTEDDCSLLEQFRWKEKNSADTSETSEENRKRKLSNEEDISHDTDAQKRSRPEVCETNDQVTFDFSENRYINPDSQINEITMSSQIALNSGSLASINSEFSYSEKSHSKNKELKAFHYSGKEENLSTEQYTASNKNIFQKENEEYKIIDTDISQAANVCSVDNRLAVPGTSDSREYNTNSKFDVERLQNRSLPKQQPAEETEQKQSTCLSCKKTISEHVEVHDGKDMYRCCLCPTIHEGFNSLQMHVFLRHTFPKESAEIKITDTDISQAANVFSVDDRLAVPGTSHSLENISCSQLCVERVQNVSPLKQQPPVETEQIQLPCLSCSGTVSQHVEVHDGKDMYKCCRCAIREENYNYLQIHVYNVHSRPYYCNACQMNYSDAGTHGPGQTCDVCYENFDCKYQLEEHYYFNHEKISKTHCRICQKEFDDHTIFSKGLKIYQCCFRDCEYQNNKKKLNDHLYSHFLLKIYKCDVCGNHFKHSSYVRNHLKGLHPLCELCGKRFLNIHFLYKHLCEEHEDK